MDGLLVCGTNWIWQTERAEAAGQQGPDGRILHLGHILYLQILPTNIRLKFTQIFAQISHKYLLKFHTNIWLSLTDREGHCGSTRARWPHPASRSHPLSGKLCPKIFARISHKYLLEFYTNICSNFIQIFAEISCGHINLDKWLSFHIIWINIWIQILSGPDRLGHFGGSDRGRDRA